MNPARYSSSSLTPRQRAEAALEGGHADKVPFTIYSQMVPMCAAERELRNRGLCLVKNMNVFTVTRPHVKVTETVYAENGHTLKRAQYETPAGVFSILTEQIGGSTWHHERPFKSPADYPAIRFFIEDECYTPDYAGYRAAVNGLGDDFVCPVWFGSDPMQNLVIHLIGVHAFCLEWMDNRDEILRLYDAVYANRRRQFPLVAAAPGRYVSCGSNVIPEITGLPDFERYHLPYFQEACEIFHRHGKRVGYHFDANCRLLAPAIARSGLDYIEAFTPAPDTDMTLAEARAAWPDKVIWMNFPSSVHLRSDPEVEKMTMDLLSQAGSPDGLLMGITEDAPPDRWSASCRAILDGLDQHAREYPEQYHAP